MDRRRLVVVALPGSGRLGNQLFCFALGRALHRDGAVPLDNRMQPAIADLESALVPGAFRLITRRETLVLQPRLARGKLRIWRAIEHRTRRWRRSTEYREPVAGEYDPEVFRLEGPILLKGYFQNEAYFRDVADRVVADLRPPTAEFHAGLDRFRHAVGGDGPTVAVVVRAGLDYENAGWAHRYAWYRRAAQQLTDRIGHPRFAVFSDIPLVAEAVAVTLEDLGPAVPFLHVDPVAQLHLIAAMDHAVIAASSFAWWGAWLGDHRRAFSDDRVVLRPEPWVDDTLAGIPPNRWEHLSQTSTDT